MLIIDDMQWRGLESAALGSFARRAAMFLKQHFPDLADAGEAALAEEIAPLVSKAGAYGFTQEREVIGYILAAKYLGANFDSALPHAREILTVRGESACLKAAKLEKFVTAVLVQLHQGNV